MPLFLFFNTETLHIKPKAQNSIVMNVVHVQYTTGKQFIVYMDLHFALFGDKYNLNFACRFVWQSQREATVSRVLQVTSVTQYC
jgi:hypothetical protein